MKQKLKLLTLKSRLHLKINKNNVATRFRSSSSRTWKSALHSPA